MMDDAAKAVRRAQIQRELPPLRMNRDNNVRNRNQSNEQIEELRSARDKLRNCLSTMSEIRRNVRNCHSIVGRQDFRGSRRRQLESRLSEASERIRTQRESHVRNRDRIVARIATIREQRDNLNATIRSQNDRISAFETELRGLW